MKEENFKNPNLISKSPSAVRSITAQLLYLHSTVCISLGQPPHQEAVAKIRLFWILTVPSHSYKLHQIQPQSCLNRATFAGACAQHCCYQDVWYWNPTYPLCSKIISDCNFVPGCALSPQTPHRTHACAICKYIRTREFWAPARKQNISRKNTFTQREWKFAWQQK